MNALSAVRPHALIAVAAAVLLAGCASQTPTRTGFLDRYDEPSSRSTTTADLTRYSRFIVDPIEFRPGTTVSSNVDAAAVERLKGELEGAIRKVFSSTHAPAERPGPGVLRVRYAITGVETSQPTVNALTVLLIGPVSNGGVSTEGEVVDSVTGERLAALVTATNALPWRGGLGGYFSSFGHASTLLAQHAELLHRQLVPPVTAAGPGSPATPATSTPTPR